VNSIIAAMVVNANKSSGIIYHVGTSLRNPIKFCDIHDIVFSYCTENPWINKDGTIVKVEKCTMFKTMASFRMYMQIRFMLPLQVCFFVPLLDWNSRECKTKNNNFNKIR
jgi:fatty acyl-CoA reductase